MWAQAVLILQATTNTLCTAAGKHNSAEGAHPSFPPSRMKDVAYQQQARCRGLASSDLTGSNQCLVQIHN
jgi:hypothetical protein